MIPELERQCPWCWESIPLAVDASAGSSEYVEDCPVCCHPMLVRLRLDPDGRYTIDLEREND